MVDGTALTLTIASSPFSDDVYGEWPLTAYTQGLKNSRNFRVSSAVSITI
jgi:hypothetical protein